MLQELSSGHYSDVIMSTMAFQITTSWLFTQLLIEAQIKENIKASRHWALCGEYTSDQWILRTKDQ